MTLVYRNLLYSLLFILSSISWSAEDSQATEQAKQQIQTLQKDLERLKRQLEDLKSERSDVENQLESKEKSIQDLLKKILNTQQDLHNAAKQLGEFRPKQRSFQLSSSQNVSLVEKMDKPAILGVRLA